MTGQHQEDAGLIPVRDAHKFDEAALADYLRGKIDGATAPLTVRQFHGGQSNPTFVISFGTDDYVLRKKPPGKLLPSAHAVEREYRVQKALAGSGLPLAEMHLLCEDESVIGTPFYVMAVYPHHLLQDMVMPGWMLIMGQIVSYLSGLPLLVVTAFSLLVYLRGSGIRWDLASALLVLGVAGWSVGVVPAVIDGMISVNVVMHNTQWVPGHFHIYLLLGEVAMAFGFMAWLVKGQEAEAGFGAIDRTAFAVYVAGGTGFVLMFLLLRRLVRAAPLGRASRRMDASGSDPPRRREACWRGRR